MRLNAIPAVLALNVALAGTLAYLWSDAARFRWAEPAALAPSLEEIAAAPASEPVDVSRHRETLERPLFAATRKMAPRRDPAADAAAADSLKDVRLLGSYGAGDRGGIIVVSGGKVQRVPVGQSIGGWKVTAGSAGRSVELVRDSGERRRLELALNNVAPAVPGAAKPGTAEAAQAAAPDQAPASASTGGATSSRPAAARRWDPPPGAAGAGEEARRRRQERLDQRRAAERKAQPQ